MRKQTVKNVKTEIEKAIKLANESEPEKNLPEIKSILRISKIFCSLIIKSYEKEKEINTTKDKILQ
ncbi:MAG: hypothetical protein ACOCRX_03300 [Candidatus Woesearchaeota archaeon]